MADAWPGFAQTEGSERGGDTIEVVDYDSGWSVRFAQWRDRLEQCLGASALRIDHVGSTSVPAVRFARTRSMCPTPSGLSDGMVCAIPATHPAQSVVAPAGTSAPSQMP